MMNAALHDICTRIARLETERKELAAEVAKIKKQAKEDGYDAGLITKTVAIMLKSGKKQREALEQHELFDTYLNAVGLLSEAGGDDQSSASVTPIEKPDEFTVSINGGPHVPLSTVRVALNQIKAASATPPHDPTTGEIHDPPDSPLPGGDDEDLVVPRSSAGDVSTSPADVARSIDMPPIPEALDRRARASA